MSVSQLFEVGPVIDVHPELNASNTAALADEAIKHHSSRSIPAADGPFNSRNAPDSASSNPGSNQINAPSDTGKIRAQRLVVADPGEGWLDRLFDDVRSQVAAIKAPQSDALWRWLEYKRRSIALGPHNWLVLYEDSIPVGLTQGNWTAGVYYSHFFFVQPSRQSAQAIRGGLEAIQEVARKKRCHTISLEGPNTGTVLMAMGPERITEAGYTWHQRLHLGLQLNGFEPMLDANGFIQVRPLDLEPESIRILMTLESTAFQHAACEHPAELPMDFSDGYRTSLLSMRSTSAMALTEDGAIRGALYAEGKGKVVWLHTLFVDPRWRNRGIARALLETCLAQHRELGYSTTELVVLAANHPALRLYQSAGFHEIKRVNLFLKKLD